MSRVTDCPYCERDIAEEHGLDCPRHSSYEKGERPDAAPPKEVPESRPGEKKHLLSGYVDARGWPQPGEPPSKAAPPPSDAAPCPTCGKHDNPVCSNIYHPLREGHVYKDGVLQDAAPVAWRIRSLEPGAAGTWFYQDKRPHLFTFEDPRCEVQRLYAHPEDATTNELPGPSVVGSCEGPWRSENIGDADRVWGPTVWDSRVDRDGYAVPGTSRFHFDTLVHAEAVRDALNRVDRLKGDET